MKILRSAFVILLPITLNAQIIDGIMQRQVEILKQSNVDTFLVFTLSCNGGLIPFDSCAYEETQYLFWMQNSMTFLKPFDYCKDFKAIQIDSLNPLSFYLKNKKKIDKEKIEQPTYYEFKKNKNSIDSVVTIVSTDHSCYHQFEFIVDNSTIKKSIDIFDLNYAKFDNGKKNIYYSYNQQSKQKILIEITSRLIEQLKNSQKFEAQ